MKGFKLGLIVKFALSVAVTLTFSVLALSYFTVRIEKIRAETELKNKGATLAQNLAHNSEYGILSNNTESLDRLAEGAMIEDVIYVQIMDSQGKILARAQKTPAEAGTVDFSKALDFTVPVISFRINRPAEEIGLEPFASAKTELKEGSKVGTARLGISLARVDKIVHQLLGLIWGVALAVMLVGAVSLTILTRLFLIQPLAQFAASAKKITQGDLASQVKVESRDEIGELANSFNAMTDNLVGYAKELEKKVAERTQALETGMAKLAAAKTDLEQKVAELKEFHDLTVGRELKMIGLEKETDGLLQELGRPPKYQ